MPHIDLKSRLAIDLICGKFGSIFGINYEKTINKPVSHRLCAV